MVGASVARSMSRLVLLALVGLAPGCRERRLPYGATTVPPAPLPACPAPGAPDSATLVRDFGNKLQPGYLAPLDDCHLLFVLMGTPSGVPWPLWRTDGTLAGTQEVASDFGVGLGSYRVGGALVLSSLWRTDGTGGGTFKLADGLWAYGTNHVDAALLGDALLFAASDDPPGQQPAATSHGVELWKTDGSRAGTALAAETIPGPDPVYADRGPTAFVRAGDLVFFSEGFDLWRTDGTMAGTFKIAPIQRGTASVVLGSTLFFVGAQPGAAPGSTVFGLWRTDGTEADTVLLRRLDAPTDGGASFYGPRDNLALATLGSNVLLIASSAPALNLYNIMEPRLGPPIDALWISDWTPAGTRLLLELPQVAETSVPPWPRVLDGVAYFASTSGSDPSQPPCAMLWRTDGTREGTLPLANITSWMGVGTHQIFFAGYTPADGPELWRTDGTRAGTRQVLPGHAGPLDGCSTVRLAPDLSQFPSAATIGDQLLYARSGSDVYLEPWVTDGTPEGTRIVPTEPATAAPLSPLEFTRVNDAVYFTALTRDSRDYSLWRYVPPRP